MDAIQKQKMQSATRVNKDVWFKNKETGQSILWGKVVDEVDIIVGEDTGDPYKHMIQKIQPEVEIWDGSKYLYRTGYYTFSAKDPHRLVWGQYTQCLTECEYQKLLGKAKEKGWLLK